MSKRQVGVLISGSGTNLQALIDACAQPGYPAAIAIVISNKEDAYGLERARKAGIPTLVIGHKDYASRELYDSALHHALMESGVEFVCLAGFMRLLTADFVARWHNRMINIHPSLLPAFKGLHTHEHALKSGVRFSGCTVHFVRSEMDSGPVIVQAAVPVLPGDTPQTLGARVLAQEHQCYPLALSLLTQDRLAVEDERVIITDHSAPESSLVNPLPLPPSS